MNPPQVMDICFQISGCLTLIMGFPGNSMVKNPPADAGDARDIGWIPGSGRSPGKGNGYPLRSSCLKNSIDREAWRATVDGVTKSWT